MAEQLTPFSQRQDNESLRQRVRELPQFKEDWRVNFGALTISGESGTGKTTLADILAQIYKIPDDNNMKIGQILRTISQKPQEEGPIQRAISDDEFVDNAQREIIKKADTKNPFILESRLAGVITSEEKSVSPQLPIVSILLTASLDNITARIQSRRPELSKEEIAKKMQERAQDDLMTWRKSRKDLHNPYDPKYFNLVIDTDSMSPEQVFTFLHDWLLKNGFVAKVEKTNESPTEHQVFPNRNS